MENEPKRISKTDETLTRIVLSTAPPIILTLTHIIIESIFCTGDCPPGGMGCYVQSNCFIQPGWGIPYLLLFITLNIIMIYYINKLITKHGLYEDETQ